MRVVKIPHATAAQRVIKFVLEEALYKLCLAQDRMPFLQALEDFPLTRTVVLSKRLANNVGETKESVLEGAQIRNAVAAKRRGYLRNALLYVC